MPDRTSGDERLTVYRPDTRVRDNTFQAVSRLGAELWRHRWHVSTRFRNEFKGKFNQTALGMVWQFVEPVIPISAYALLAYIAVFPTRGDMPALVYIAIGITLWMLMTDGINRQMSALHSAKVVLNKSNFPMIGVLAGGFAQSAFETLVRLAAVLVIYALLVGAPPWRAVLALPMLVPMVLFAVGLGMALAVLNVVYRDIENVVQIILRYGFFLSLAIFPLPDHPVVDRVLAFNPFAVFIDNIRTVLVLGTPADFPVFIIWSGVSLVVFLAGAKLAYVMEPRLRGFL
jgi:lipopolysaccharide transport system permease protein